jgi:putative DNA-invertase from lambdoid prophage Rac
MSWETTLTPKFWHLRLVFQLRLRSMISSRTKEALARKKSEGMQLGRPKGRLSGVTKLTSKDDLIREYLKKQIPQSVVARLLGVHRLTVRNYIITRKLKLDPA